MPRIPTDTINAVIGGNLRRFRKQVGWSQGQLAETVGVTTQQISKYEKGEDQISAPMLTRLANALRVVVGELLHGTATLAAPSAGFGEAASTFRAEPRTAHDMSPEEARRALLRVYDELNQPLKDVALRQVQALLYLQVPEA